MTEPTRYEACPECGHVRTGEKRRRHLPECRLSYVGGRPKEDMLSRFMRQVDRGSECWIWTGQLKTGGYPYFDGARAHRWSYEFHVGPIPDGLVIDHLCHVRACVNPSHLEAVTQRENLMRSDTFQARNAAKTHCVNGHPFDATNTAISVRPGRPGRVCRACKRDVSRRLRAEAAKRRAA